MDINAVKTVLAKHFDRYSNKTADEAQYLGGEYWLPKHDASLRDLLDEFIEDEGQDIPLSKKQKETILSAINDLRSTADDIESAIEDEL